MNSKPSEDLPVIAKPCPMDWDGMDGDARRRHCESCRLTVTNLSALAEKDRRTFLRRSREEPEKRVCIAYERRRDGTPVLRSRWDWFASPFRAARRAVLAAAAVCLPMAFSNCASRKPMMGRYSPSGPGPSQGTEATERAVVPGMAAWPDARDEDDRSRMLLGTPQTYWDEVEQYRPD
jgi:hypothetical protein